MLMQLKNSEDWRSTINANFAKMAPLPIFQFLSYINIIYLKRTDFSHRIRIQEKIAQSYIKNFEKNQFSQVPITESIPLQIATIMSMMKYEFEQYKDCKFEEKINFHLVLSELPAKQWQPSRPQMAILAVLFGL